ncbi:hypothetical protein EB796_023902 [Bugula neritina]|uniref:Uncharacterized protein n=1 Tax=Bugula neritina TaxID=10212 RepID=A0A7J7IWL5_BUGNE|nr:hypothetical protein EB796_023902 [Bugula neritina]
MATVRIRRVGAKTTPTSTERCEASSSTKPTFTDSDAEEILNVPDVKCMVTEWSEFDACSVTCGVGTKTRTRQFKSPWAAPKRVQR